MERSVNVMSVINVDIPGMMIVESPTVVIHVHIAHTVYPIPVIADINITDLGDTTVIIVIYRYIFYLYHSTIIVVLGIGAIIVTGVKSHSISTSRNIFVYREIKFPIRIYRKRNAVLDKNKGVVIAIGKVFRNLIPRVSGSCGHGTGGT